MDTTSTKQSSSSRPRPQNNKVRSKDRDLSPASLKTKRAVRRASVDDKKRKGQLYTSLDNSTWQTPWKGAQPPKSKSLVRPKRASDPLSQSLHVPKPRPGLTTASSVRELRRPFEGEGEEPKATGQRPPLITSSSVKELRRPFEETTPPGLEDSQEFTSDLENSFQFGEQSLQSFKPVVQNDDDAGVDGDIDEDEEAAKIMPTLERKVTLDSVDSVETVATFQDETTVSASLLQEQELIKADGIIDEDDDIDSEEELRDGVMRVLLLNREWDDLSLSSVSSGSYQRSSDRNTSYRIQYSGPTSKKIRQLSRDDRFASVERKTVAPSPPDRTTDLPARTLDAAPAFPARTTEEGGQIRPDVWITPLGDPLSDDLTLSWKVKRVWGELNEGMDESEHTVHAEHLFDNIKILVGVPERDFLNTSGRTLQTESTSHTGRTDRAVRHKDNTPKMPARNWKVQRFIEDDGELKRADEEERSMHDDEMEKGMDEIVVTETKCLVKEAARAMIKTKRKAKRLIISKTIPKRTERTTPPRRHSAPLDKKDLNDTAILVAEMLKLQCVQNGNEDSDEDDDCASPASIKSPTSFTKMPVRRSFQYSKAAPAAPSITLTPDAITKLKRRRELAARGGFGATRRRSSLPPVFIPISPVATELKFVRKMKRVSCTTYDEEDNITNLPF
jgi:hypothetical protein